MAPDYELADVWAFAQAVDIQLRGRPEGKNPDGTSYDGIKGMEPGLQRQYAQEGLDHIIGRATAKPDEIPDGLLPDAWLPEYGQPISGAAIAWLRKSGIRARMDRDRAALRQERRGRRLSGRVEYFIPSRSAESVVMAHEAEADLHRAIDALPPKLRAVTEYIYLGYPVREIAEMLDISPRAVYKRLAEIRSGRIKRLILECLVTNDVVDDLAHTQAGRERLAAA